METLWFTVLLLVQGLCNAEVSTKYELEDRSFCLNKSISLGNSHYSSIVLSKKHNEQAWNGSSDFKCAFELQSRDPIALVIQNLDFRVNSSTKECIDFIQFRTPEENAFRKYCGKLSALKYTGDERGEASPYLNLKNGTVVEIFVSKESRNEFDLSVSFTAWKNCSEADLPREYARCGKTDTCIWEGLLWDASVVNCPYNGCLDEFLCGYGWKWVLLIVGLIVWFAIILIVVAFLMVIIASLIFLRQKCRAPRERRPEEITPAVVYRHRPTFNMNYA